MNLEKRTLFTLIKTNLELCFATPQIILKIDGIHNNWYTILYIHTHKYKHIYTKSLKTNMELISLIYNKER